MRTLFLLTVLLFMAGCRQSTPTPDTSAQTTQAADATATAQPVQIAITIDPNPPAVGAARARVTITQQSQPLANIAVAVRGDMTHAGMAPLLVNGVTDNQGQIDFAVKWSMSGDWIVTVTATLPDKSKISQDFNITVKP